MTARKKAPAPPVVVDDEPETPVDRGPGPDDARTLVRRGGGD